MKTGKMVGLDTNILVYADDPLSSHYRTAKQVLEAAFRGVLQLCLSHQVLAEYFSVITRSQKVANPLTAAEAKDRVLFLERTRRIKKIYPKHSTLRRCVELCAEYNIQGLRIFDALYGLTLLDNKVHQLLTNNPKDFIFLKDLESLQLEDMKI